VAEAAKDVTVQTSLLEVAPGHRQPRCLRSCQRFKAGMDPQAFFVAKTLELRQRHTKYEDTPYALEPNCKESPGGLRDLQVILWVAKAAAGQELGRAGAKAAWPRRFEARQIKRNEALLSLIRARLHLLATGARTGWCLTCRRRWRNPSATPTQCAPTARPLRASEVLMKRYYWAAKAVTQLNQILLLNIEERLNPSPRAAPDQRALFDKAGMIEVASDDLYQREPHADPGNLPAVPDHRGHQGPVGAHPARAVQRARRDGRKVPQRPGQPRTFMAILQQPEGITHAMRLMNQTSVLGRYLWVFRRIVGQMQHDLFHVYTVDQHILMVLRNVRRFFIVEHAHEYPFCSQLAAGWDKPWILYAAALFHDIAKGRGGDHSELGARDVRASAASTASSAMMRLIEFLVHEHLTMSRIAQKEDLSDPT
jgi:[protein-PII] uridylyltransferase